MYDDSTYTMQCPWYDVIAHMQEAVSDTLLILMGTYPCNAAALLPRFHSATKYVKLGA